MRVVLDSNVIVAAFATRGLCEAVFEYSLENLDLCICNEILIEVNTVLARKIRIPRVLADEIGDYLGSNLRLVKPAEVPTDVCRDSTDLAVIGAAVAAGAEYLVTGDSDLLSLGRH